MTATRHVAATAGVLLFLFAGTGEHGLASETPSAARCVCDSSADPGPRSSHQLIYHRQLRRVILLDGYLWPSAAPPPNQAELTEVWAWDGHLWTPLPGVGPASRYVSAATFDSRRMRLISYGGRVGPQETVTNETWEWIRPVHRQHHAITYDPAARRTILHGGLTRDHGGIEAPARDDLWSWDGRSWTLISQHSGVARVGHLLFADGSGGLFVAGGEPQGTTARWDGRRWVTLADDAPLRRAFAAGAYDSRRKRFVVFGGRINAMKRIAGDTWEFDGQRWSEVAAPGPPPMLGASMAFDERRRVVVLFGGRNGPTFFGDTWTWDGARWQRVATTGPSPRFEPGMVYDARRGEVVLFGGYHSTGRLGDTWIWDGDVWRQVDDSGPSPRNEGFAAYDASRATTVLFGGCCSAPAGGTLGDTWEWDGQRWAEIK